MALLLEETCEALWMVAGMTRGDSGSLDRPLPDAGVWHIPAEAVAFGGLLQWRRLGLRSQPTANGSEPNMLEAFIRLANAQDDSVARFALRWGVLRDGEWLLEGSEPLAEWRAVAEHFAAVMDVAARLRIGDAVDPERWARLGRTGLVDVELLAGPDGEPEVRLRHQLWPLSPFARQCSPPEAVGYIVSGWLRRSAVGLGLSWTDRPQVVLVPRSLLGGLALQLAFAVSGADGLALCSSCGRPFTPKRRPAAGRRAYCPTCGVRAARRDAQRDYRRKAKEG